MMSRSNMTQYLFEECPPQTNSVPAGVGAWQKYKHTSIIFASTAGARGSLFHKLCMVVKDVLPIIKSVNYFSIQRRVFHTGCKMLIFGLWVETNTGRLPFRGILPVISLKQASRWWSWEHYCSQLAGGPCLPNAKLQYVVFRACSLRQFRAICNLLDLCSTAGITVVTQAYPEILELGKLRKITLFGHNAISSIITWQHGYIYRVDTFKTCMLLNIRRWVAKDRRTSGWTPADVTRCRTRCCRPTSTVSSGHTVLVF